MTNPPQGSDEHAGEEPTRPVPPPAPPGYGAGTNPPYGTPSYGPPGGGTPFHGVPGPAPYTGQPQQYGQQPQYGPPQPAVPYGPPAYGAPYGAPPPPAQKSRVGLIAVVTGIALLLIAGVVVLVLARQSTVLDPAAVERDVASQFEQREGVAVDLDCGETMTVRSGATYTCTGRTADGESVTLKIAITDPKTAAYTWTEP